MQNFVSKCIQTFNSHKSIQAANEPAYFEPYKHVGDPGSNPVHLLPNQNTSYVIGALPSRPKITIRKSSKTNAQTTPTPLSPDQSVEVVMINSLPTLSPCNSYPPNVVRKQLRQKCCTKSNSDYDLLGVHQTSFESLASQSRDDLIESQSGSACGAESIISHFHSQISTKNTCVSGRHLKMTGQQDPNVSPSF